MTYTYSLIDGKYYTRLGIDEEVTDEDGFTRVHTRFVEVEIPWDVVKILHDAIRIEEKMYRLKEEHHKLLMQFREEALKCVENQ